MYVLDAFLRVVLRSNPMDPNLGPLDMNGAVSTNPSPSTQTFSQSAPQDSGASFGWGDLRSPDASSTSQAHEVDHGQASAKFQRYPSLGSPNISTAPFYFNIG